MWKLSRTGYEQENVRQTCHLDFLGYIEGIEKDSIQVKVSVLQKEGGNDR